NRDDLWLRHVASCSLCTTHRFGSRMAAHSRQQGSIHPLTHVRHLRGWSMADVARLVQHRTGLNMATWRQKVYRWEHGGVPEAAAQAALAEELGVDKHDLQRFGWPNWLLAVEPGDPLHAPWTPQAAHQLLETTVESAAMDRRSFLSLTAA